MTEMTDRVGESFEEVRDALRRALRDDATLVRAVASGRQRNATVPFRRVEARYVDVKAGRRLQLTSYDDTQSHIRNVEPGPAADEAVEDLLSEAYAHWHVQTTNETLQVRVTKKGRPMLHRAKAEAPVTIDHSHDRVKRRRLDESDPLFRVLGVTTSDGKVKPSRVAKFRQVQDLLAALEPTVEVALSQGPGDDLSHDRPLRVVDLGCGNAYLTFAAYRYLAEVKALPVHVIGVDVKAQARAHNSDVAQQLGIADQLEFVESTISAAEVPDPPDLVLALHACDTATDEALARAVRWQAPVILAAPCCHHDIQRQLSSDRTPSAYRLITRHGILKERFADVLTDALRAAILRLVGYRVEVIEFVDTQHTPRNALIRAVRTSGGPGAEQASDTLREARNAYQALVSEWGVRPALAELLMGSYPDLVPLSEELADDASGVVGRHLRGGAPSDDR